MTLRKTVLILCALAATSAIAWFFLRTSGKSSSAALKKPGATATVTVRAEEVRAMPFTETITLTGSVVAEQSIEVRAEVSGRIQRIGIREGADVDAGTLLVKLVDADLVAQKKKLLQQHVLDKNRLARLEKLRPVDGVSLDEYEQAAAQVEIRSAEIAALDAMIEKTEVRAPFAGRLGLRNVSVGAVITPQTILTTLTSVSTLNVDCNVPERYTAALANGGALRVRVRGADTTTRLATIVAIEPIVDVQTRTQRVRARIEQPKGVTAGMFADVVLTLRENPSTLLVPTESVVQDMKGASVFRIENGIARSTPVTLSTRTASHVVVSGGLASGDSIVVSGVLFVKDGASVTVRDR